jgi:DNA-directed RNA polymerase specialized sigma24 family protein
MRLSKKKGFRVLLTRPCGEGSPYWDWLATHVHNEYDYLNEPVEANPDVLPEAAHIYQHKLSDGDRERLDAIGRAWAILSDRERMVLRMLGNEGRRPIEVAELLHISEKSVRVYVSRASKKIAKIYERLSK